MTLLSTRNLVAHYGDFQALYGIDTDLGEGETVAVIGANGAGKSTYLHSIAGLLPGAGEAVRFEGRPIGRLSAPEIARLGLSLVPEGRRLFPFMSVPENLQMGAVSAEPRHYEAVLERVFTLYPILRERRYTSQWASMFILLYFTEGVVRASDPGLGGTLALAEAILSALFFACVVLYARQSAPSRQKA